jgi:type VI secretion system protein ImpA
MNQILQQRAADSCALLLGVALSALLAPIDPGAPGGASARSSGVYNTIAQARRADDASLPMGPWQHELKRADWDRVSQVAVHALANQGKDLQVAAWLLEAQINKNGFAGIAASLHVMQQLCDCYWDELHPLADEVGLAHRANIFQWMNEKLLPALRQVPLAGVAPAPQYSFADWERARRHEQLRDSDKDEDADGPTSADLTAAIAATPTAQYVTIAHDLDAALLATAELMATITPRLGDQTPSLSAFSGLLDQMRGLVLSELHQRGVRPAALASMEPAPASEPGSSGSSDAPSSPPYFAPGQQHVAEEPPKFEPHGIRDREHAFAQLEEAADYLMRVEPHSPVPYLVRRATAWGNLNASQLYQELFLRLGGQLNIFDIMGLETQRAEQENS